MMFDLLTASRVRCGVDGAGDGWCWKSWFAIEEFHPVRMLTRRRILRRCLHRRRRPLSARTTSKDAGCCY
jgi:hypothetical protein